MEIEICKRCVMDSKNDPDLILDDNGICNHCFNYDRAFSGLLKGEEREKKLRDTILKIKANGKTKKYDCLLGISGGVDSSYLALLCKRFGLRPLVIHFDNGWDSELAVKNIESILTKLDFNMTTYVVDWNEFKDIQRSYFKAGVVDLEFPTDHAIGAVMFSTARKHGIKYILSGHNVVTEGTKMPASWVHSKWDSTNLKDIHAKFGTIPIKNFPYITFIRRLLDHYFKTFEYIQLLNLVDYNKQAAKQTLMQELGWRDYGGKHYESVFTRFYQGYILPKRFNIDKRVFHCSTLVQSGQMTREEALSELKREAYEPELLLSDYEYVLKKLDFTKEYFEAYMKSPIRKHQEFKVDQTYWEWYFKIIRVLNLFRLKRNV